MSSLKPLSPPAPGEARIVPLGGLGEIGMNCLAIEHHDGILVVDCGVTFPSTDLGIDVYHPRFDYLIERADKIVGLVITHGHEDHIGAIPYLLGVVDAPIYAPPHALELTRLRLAERGYDLGELDLVPTTVGKRFELGSFGVEPIRVTHSIADATALAIHTAAGLVVHSGDFKLDPSPPDGEVTDEDRLSALGDEGVKLLLSDSTNVDSPGWSASERGVGEALHEAIARAKARVFLGMFASNVQRLRLVGDIAMATGRRLCLLGRSVGNHVRAAQAVGRLSWPSSLVIGPDEAAAMPKERVLVLASGTQGERNSALVRLAAGTHPAMRIQEGDLLILSSRVIPGNDRVVVDMMGDFLRLGVEVISRVTDPRVHASGHAHREEQLRMIELVRPEGFLPIHGSLHHLMRHAALARDAGVGSVVVAENGTSLRLHSSGVERAEHVPCGRVATWDGHELPDDLLRERAQIGRAGAAFVTIVLDKRGFLSGTPQVHARGVPVGASPGSLRRAAQAVARAISDADPRYRTSDEDVSELARSAARRAIEACGGGRPVVSVAVTRL